MATVLVADDNRANREALAALLESAGHRVLRAADGREALSRAREACPDLVISDVLMPLMDGYELARRLRAEPATAAVALMFYTAYFGGQDAQALAQAHGVSRVLLKPSDNASILRQVDAVLASRGETPAQIPRDLDREHLRVVVDQLLEKTGTLEVQQRRIERLNRTLEVLSAVNALIVRAGDRQALLDEACRIAVEKGGFRLAAIGLAEPRSHQIRQVAAAGEGSAERDFARLKLGTRSLVWNDAHSGSFVALPLLVAGESAGLLLLYASQRDFFDEEEMRLLHELACDIAFALRHLAQKARMDYLAYHDSLTDLPNRSLFTDRMTQALSAARRERRFAAAIFVDVERLRRVNESFGRKSGDDLLREVGARLRRAAREQDTVARVGGDHFAIAVAPFDRPGDTAYAFLERLDEALAQPIAIEGAELRVSVKAGIAVFPTDADSTEALCANAETALLKAKQTASRYLFYAPDMNARVAESLAMENRLRLALDDGTLALHYQPKIDVATGEVAGLEALIRWNDAELGAVPPSRFVSLLEETGMILAAGRWALHKAVADIHRWQGMGLKVPRTSVNVSALQLRQKDFVDSVLEAIAEPGGKAPLLDLEITESVLVDDIEESPRKLQALRRAGVEVSVDDFGTGFCSLSYLARLPVDTLKIDRSFVVRMRDVGYPRNIVAMIVSLAHTLGLRVVAEGVEDDQQVRLLRELGCDQIQGFYVSRPVPAEDVDAMLDPGASKSLQKRLAAA
ncbi:MAG TPA: EAL domain-containing protein [Burkholderiales bacterium]|jgi:diguanylate cyclase (GGDEF)-like protein|nr:EAL domain-containing protein [Burkholderiales bacterium]